MKARIWAAVLGCSSWVYLRDAMSGADGLREWASLFVALGCLFCAADLIIQEARK